MTIKEKFLINQLNNGFMKYTDPKIVKPISNPDLALACVGSVSTNFTDKMYGLSRLFNEISDELKNDKRIVKSFLAQDAKLYRDLPSKMKNDDSIIKYALKKSVKNFNFLSFEQQKNKEYIDFITSERNAMSWINPELLKDKEIALYMLGRNVELLDYSPKFIREDEEISRFAVWKSSRAIMFVENNNVKNDEEIAERVILDNVHLFQYCGKNIRDNEKFASMAVEINSNNFVYVSSNMKKRKYIALKAVREESLYLEVDESLKEDDDFLKQALLTNIKVEIFINKDRIESFASLEWLEDLMKKNEKTNVSKEFHEMLERKRRVKQLEDSFESIQKDKVDIKRNKI